jgi:hypothetical protein
MTTRTGLFAVNKNILQSTIKIKRGVKNKKDI